MYKGIVFGLGLLLTSAGLFAADPLPTTPSLKVQTLDHGSFDLAAQRGSYVIVNFWATWCTPCIKEMPEFKAFDEARTDATVIGLAYEEIDEADLRNWLSKRPAGYPIALIDVFEPASAELGTPRGLPYTVIVGPDGAVMQRFTGPVTAKELQQALPVLSDKDRG